MRRTSRKGRIFIYSLVVLLGIAFAGYFIGQSVIRKKVVAALRSLPPAYAVSCSSIEPGLLTGSLVIHDLHIRLTPGPDTAHRHEVSIGLIAVHGISYFSLLSSHRLHIRSILLDSCVAELDDYLLEKKVPLPKMQGQGQPPPFKEVTIDEFELPDMKAMAHTGTHNETLTEIAEEHHKKGETLFFDGSLTVHSIHVNDINQPIDTNNVHFGDARLVAKDVRYLVTGAYQRLRLSTVELNTKDSSLRIDTARIYPTVNKEKLGQLKGVQEDVVEGISEGIEVSGLDCMAFLRHRFIAEKVSIKKNNFHVFRDRRLKREEDEKAMPIDFLKTLPVTVRIKSVKFGPTNFAYEEFPGKGDQPGVLRIVGLTGTLHPLINHPVEGDPSYLTMSTEGSLMGSGTVTATTKMPLHKGDPYEVQGAFHELDVTSLNGPAENLGLIHLKSGMLNLLAFQFSMTDEKSTGKIVGEYHNLVVQKMKEKNDEKKIDKMKSFALKEFIIPLNKDKSMPESKRTGKVDYKRDRSRMFSYYLLHSLLVGVKGSFKLGFLLPG